MRLDLFDVLDEACEILVQRRDDFIEAEVRLIQCLKSVITSNEDSVLEMSSRIKSTTSLREKIIRNKLYHDMTTGEEVIDSLHDLIGVTIKCQFIKEEKRLYQRIQEVFRYQGMDGFYYTDKFPTIFFDLVMPQPQIQKNGYEVYRIDGFCMIGEKRINFELQIKAIVFTFWSEIEHQIVYKNNNYSLNNEFITQLLGSIRTSLNGIDSQLNIIYNEMQSRNSQKRSLDENSVKHVIAKSINDIFIDKIQESIGFTINFKKECDLLSGFLYNRQDTDANEKTIFVNIANRLQEIKDRRIDFEQPIIFDNEIGSDDRFMQIIGSGFLWYMNGDFEWYVFFKMMFELMPASNDEDFTLFLKLYKLRFENRHIYKTIEIHFSKSEYEEIVGEILANIALALVETGTISILHEEKLDALIPFLVKFCDIFAYEITDYASWLKYQSNIMADLRSQITNQMR